MDDLEFRRTIYADPNSKDEALKVAAKQDPKKQQFWNEVKKLDADIKQQLHAEVPQDLAHRIVLQQSLQQHQQLKSRQPWYVAMAASVALMIGISFTLLNAQPIDLAEHALTHVNLEGDSALNANEHVNLQQLNAKLASMGGKFDDDIGEIYFANYCDFDQVRSLHVVLKGEQGRVTVFIVPHNPQFALKSHFADSRFIGQGIDIGKATLLVVGEKTEPLFKTTEKLQKHLLFSA
ncbi:DUF3379 family protein [Alteromonadaceae bacterium BrNp21-10]|nr:DUF3379 family protein [Alteromonadaceae bacterium BrNp21-10]